MKVVRHQINPMCSEVFEISQYGDKIKVDAYIIAVVRDVVSATNIQKISGPHTSFGEDEDSATKNLPRSFERDKVFWRFLTGNDNNTKHQYGSDDTTPEYIRRKRIPITLHGGLGCSYDTPTTQTHPYNHKG